MAPRYPRPGCFIKRIEITDLLSLLELNVQQLLVTLNDKRFGFELYLEGRTYDIEELEIMLDVLARICQMREKSPLKIRLLNTIKKYDAFLFNDVPKVIHECLLKKSKFDLVSYVANYLIILRELLVCFSYSKVVDTFPLLQNYLNRMTQFQLPNLQTAIDHLEVLKQRVERYEAISSDDDAEDVDDVQLFRNLSVVPRVHDVLNYETVKIPTNIVQGSFKSVGHYLSVHFRLMREDMLRAFRDCIKMCLKNNHRSSSEMSKVSGRLYDNVTIHVPPKYTVEGIQYKITVSCPSPVDWVKTKSLMPGSLICLTHDNFRTVVFVTVKVQTCLSDRCSECTLDVCIEDDLYRDSLNNKASYLVIETNAYFEAYRHLLTVLKGMSEENFPLSDIIVHLNFDSPFPDYLVTKNNQYCLHEHKDCQDASRPDCKPHPCKTFNVLELGEWPTMEELNLDDQQLEAFQTALTKKVAVIQGPPGTGKTFIGVKIVKALLENVEHKPILISCMTNHALDQFLGLILKHTRKVVRLGGQSTSKEVDPHVMNNLMDAISAYRMEGEECMANLTTTQKKSLGVARALVKNILDSPARLICTAADELRSLCNDLNDDLRTLELCENKYADSSALNAIMDDNYKLQLRKGSSSSVDSLSVCLFEWLNVTRSTDLYEKCKMHWQPGNLQKYRNPNNAITKEVKDLWKTISLSDRYALLYMWRDKCLQILRDRIQHNREEYRKLVHRYVKPISSDRIELLKGADVIGVTTTGASKYRELLRLASPRIIIIEEAAEVLESHVVATLVSNVEHLILIGDHKQLKPLPHDNELAVKYKLNVSMFERLFNNNAPRATLASQHRMKPIMAELLALSIYPSLRSDQSVYKYKEILGVQRSMFFFQHNETEDANSTGTSSSNAFEAEFVAALAKFFVMQSYEQSQITILATYAAQVPLIRNKLSSDVSDVYVATVDNYQGEENDIVIVSFVRSNSSGIGFLRESNRICVALSRAKKGMFCVGNFQLFKSKSTVWEEMVDHLESTGNIGEELVLQCKKHNSTRNVKCSDDVLDFLSEGCKEKCNAELKCGHLCDLLCHFRDPNHEFYQCVQPCKKYIDGTTICPRKCYRVCKKKKKPSLLLECGHYSVLGNDDDTVDDSRTAYLCEEEVQKILPCGHEDTIPCHVDVKEHRCRALVPVKLECNHIKKVYCYRKSQEEDLEYEPCHDFKLVISPCGHHVEFPCKLDPEGADLQGYCTMSCNQLLNCGHPCVGSCQWCSGVGIHPICSAKCRLRLPCGHICDGFCNSPCPPCNRRCQVTCPHGLVCINSCLRACAECIMPCTRRCEHRACENKCFEECSVDPCNSGCLKTLPCGHECVGLCGEKCPFLCRICHDLKASNPDTDRFIMLQDCNHVIEVKEMDEFVQNRLDCFEWPCCPIEDCSTIILNSLRYKTELRKAKAFCLRSIETEEEVNNVWYLLHTMYGLDYDPPPFFQDLHKEIVRIMEHDKPSVAGLTILKSCVLSVQKLLKVYQRCGEEMEPKLKTRFDDVFLWICQHLKNASYQQLIELENAIDDIESWSKKIKRTFSAEYV